MSKVPMDGSYFARGDQVWKAPVRRPLEGGGHTITLGFPVCVIAEGCIAVSGTPSPAEQIASALNLAESIEGKP